MQTDVYDGTPQNQIPGLNKATYQAGHTRPKSDKNVKMREG
jgi:hypothetical protein